MPLYETSKNRLWPNVWKGIGVLLIILVCAFVVIGKRWQSQGDEIHLLPPSEWGFYALEFDCIHGGGPVYIYGFVERIPRSTLNACHK